MRDGTLVRDVLRVGVARRRRREHLFALPESPLRLSRRVKGRWTALDTAGLAKDLVRSEHRSQKPVERDGGKVVHPTQPPVPCRNRPLLALPTSSYTWAARSRSESSSFTASALNKLSSASSSSSSASSSRSSSLSLSLSLSLFLSLSLSLRLSLRPSSRRVCRQQVWCDMVFQRGSKLLPEIYASHVGGKSPELTYSSISPYKR